MSIFRSDREFLRSFGFPGERHATLPYRQQVSRAPGLQKLSTTDNHCTTRRKVNKWLWGKNGEKKKPTFVTERAYQCPCSHQLQPTFRPFVKLFIADLKARPVASWFRWPAKSIERPHKIQMVASDRFSGSVMEKLWWCLHSCNYVDCCLHFTSTQLLNLVADLPVSSEKVERAMKLRNIEI